MKASQNLLNKICDNLFSSLNRYLRVRELFSDKEIDEINRDDNKTRMFSEYHDSEDGEDFYEVHDCLRDLANLINEEGGYTKYEEK